MMTTTTTTTTNTTTIDNDDDVTTSTISKKDGKNVVVGGGDDHDKNDSNKKTSTIMNRMKKRKGSSGWSQWKKKKNKNKNNQEDNTQEIGKDNDKEHYYKKKQMKNIRRSNHTTRREVFDRQQGDNDHNDNDHNDIDDGYSNNNNKNNNELIHYGSYAYEEMRQLFNVQLPSSLTGTETNTNTITTDTNTNTNISNSSNTVKRKVAIILGYIGTRYGGFQINRSKRTIQAEIELALYKTQLLNQSNFGNPSKYSWSTSGRTDKGVHACSQVISLKIELPIDTNTTNTNSTNTTNTITTSTSKSAHDDDTTRKISDSSSNCQKLLSSSSSSISLMDDVRERLNCSLPTDIRVFDIVRTTRNFCARTQRNKVRYTYMIPSFCFINRTVLHNMFEDLDLVNNDSSSSSMQQGRSGSNPLTIDEIRKVQNHCILSNQQDDDKTINDENPLLLLSHRITQSQYEQLQDVLSMYIGTQSYHNFTKGVKVHEMRCNRYIMEFNVEKPVYYDIEIPSRSNTTSSTTDNESNNNNNKTIVRMEWIPTHVIGQSFLIHQIRKMICMAIDITRGLTTKDTMKKAFDKSYNHHNCITTEYNYRSSTKDNDNEGEGSGSSRSGNEDDNDDHISNNNNNIDNKNDNDDDDDNDDNDNDDDAACNSSTNNCSKKKKIIRISTAPANGLFLDMSYYDGYNHRKSKTNKDLDDLLDWSTTTTTTTLINNKNKNTKNNNEKDNDHDMKMEEEQERATKQTLSSSSSSAYERWYNFRHEHIMKHIVHEEIQQGNFIKHLYTQEYIFEHDKYYP